MENQHNQPSDHSLTVKTLNTEAPRWCAGCGDFGILMGFKRFMVDAQLLPHETVNVSGIGCSGRVSFYVNTYGVHSLHGRAIPLALGIALANSKLNLFIHSGDGDALSIGGNHLIHGINRNFNCTFIMYDNEVYGLTKNQASPTTRKKHKTNMQPYGTYLDPIYPVKFALGAGASFVANTADWLADHLVNTFKAAFAYKGFSFVHVYQRCPHFDPTNFDSHSSDWFSFLTHEKGIAPDKRFEGKTQILEHDPSDKVNAFRYAQSTRPYFGLLYQNVDNPCYDDIINDQIKGTVTKSRSGILDEYKI